MSSKNIKLVFILGLQISSTFFLHMAADIDYLLNKERQSYLTAYKFCFRPSSLFNYRISLMIITNFLCWFNFVFDPIVSVKNWTPSNEVQLENFFRSSNIITIRKNLESEINQSLTEYRFEALTKNGSICSETGV